MNVQVSIGFRGSEHSGLPKVRNKAVVSREPNKGRCRLAFHFTSSRDASFLIDLFKDAGWTANTFAIWVDENASKHPGCVGFAFGAHDFWGVTNLSEEFQEGRVRFDLELSAEGSTGALVVRAGSEYVFEKELADELSEIRPDLVFGEIILNAKKTGSYKRLMMEGEVEFLSDATVFTRENEQGDAGFAGIWFAENADLPARAFVDRLGWGPRRSVCPICVTKEDALRLLVIFDAIPLVPVFAREGLFAELYETSCLIKSEIESFGGSAGLGRCRM